MAILRTTAAGAVIAAVLACALPATAQVSPQVQQDMIQMRMVEAVKAEDYAAYLIHLAEFRRAGGRPDADMRFYEAVAHEAGGDQLAARDAIADFIERAGRNHPRYAEALALLSRVEWGANWAEASVAGMEVLLRALERGQSAVALTPLPPPSRWTDYRTFPSYGFFTSELHRGQEPMPDGGWMTFGHKPEGEIRNALPGLSDPRFPQAMLERRDATGRILWTRVYDWTQTAVIYEQPKRRAEVGASLAISPVVGQGRVQGHGPGGWRTVGDDPSTRPQVGDILTHVDGREIGPEDMPFSMMKDAGPTVRLTLQRNGKPFEVEVRLDTTQSDFKWLRREYRGPVEFARALIGGTWPPSPTPVPRQRDSWSSEIVAFLPDAEGGGGRICGNIDFGAFWDSHTQLGFWTRVKADGSLEDAFVRAMPTDHPDDPAERNDTWYDSGLIDCAGLPDGSLLTVGRGVRWVRQGGEMRGVAADRGTYIYRLFDADGRLLATHRMPGNGAEVPWPAVEVRPRLRPVEGTGGWVWQDEEFVVDARDGQIRIADSWQDPRVVGWGGRDERDGWHRIAAFGTHTRLLADESGGLYAVQAAERLADGTVVALVNLWIADRNLDMRAPDDWLIGAEVAPEDAAAGKYRDVGFLLGLDPQGGDEPLWAVRLRHNRPYPGIPHSGPFGPPHAEQADNGTYAVSTFWNDLVVLEDGTILVTTLSGAGVRARPVGQ